ncbi:NEL-type E3 ubiquitin ligase domain-containing protein [Pseudomonas xanthosomatis]|uniref:NEL-type E3 ubiquitin ligase domain-containing protein n=1 Tax=Pseudomonas xanthosomatis TaxID=2842356 RepID=UPI0035143EA1
MTRHTDPRITGATDAFIAERLPAWLRQASPAQINKLRDSFKTHRQSQEQVRARTLALIPLKAFALEQFEQAGLVPQGKTLDELEWLRVTPRFARVPGTMWPIYGPAYSRQNGLLRLMQNFEKGADFFAGTGLVDSGGYKVLSASAQTLAAGCHLLDAGGKYQARLDEVFDASAQALLKADKQAAMKLAIEVATLKGQISAAQKIALDHWVDGSDDHSATALRGTGAQLTLLGYTVADALVVALKDAAAQDKGLVLYLPSHPTHAIRHFDSLDKMAQALVKQLRQPAGRESFGQLIGLADRAAFLNKLDLRLKDAVSDLEPAQLASSDVFAALVTAQVKRVKQDAALLLVPSARADSKAAKARQQAWEAAGLTLLNLAGFFVPVIGVLLLGQLVVQTLAEACEGVQDWAHGHQHEALEHLLGVAETLAVTAAVAGGARIVARGFTRSALVDGLEPITLEDGSRRLWRNDLKVYREQPQNAELGEDGLFKDGKRRWLRLDDDFYPVHRPLVEGPWRLRHPQRAGGYGPALLGNGERGWRLLHERPLEWDDRRRLLDRLWPRSQRWTAAQAAQVLDVAGLDRDELRGLVVENRRLPVNLREVIRRFEARQRIDAFFASIKDPDLVNDDKPIQDWCLTFPLARSMDAVALRSWLVEREAWLRPSLFLHLAEVTLPDQPLVRLVRRDFAGLPAAYVLEAVADADPVASALAGGESKLPLAVAEKARALLRLAKLSRAVEGMYLGSEHTDESAKLAFALLDRLPGKPVDVQLEVRKDLGFGEVLASLEATSKNPVNIRLLRSGQTFRLYDKHLQLLATQPGEPAGICEALVAALSLAQRTAMGVDEERPVASLRQLLLGQLPATQAERMALLGWPTQPGWFNPGRRLADGRVGYLLSGGRPFDTGARRVLLERLSALYQGLSPQQVEAQLVRLLEGEGSVYTRLAQLEEDYRDLDRSLVRWASAELDEPRRSVRERLAERLRRAWRLQAEPLPDGQGQRLNLSNLQVTTLPALPGHVDFSQVTSLVINETPLDTVHSDFLRAFSALRELNLNRNRLRQIPRGIAYLAGLRHLRLANNQVRLDSTTLSALNGLPGLTHLDLSFNPLGTYLMRYNQLPHLVELNLRGCRLGAFPSGIELCGFLERADLRQNQLTTVPSEVLGMPHAYRRAFLVSGNPLSGVTLGRLYALDTIQEHAHPPEPLRAVDTAKARAVWLPGKAEATYNGRLQRWSTLEAMPNSSGLFRLLGLLQYTQAFSTARENLTARIWELLDALEGNADLRVQLYSRADVAPSCENGVASLFADLLLRVRVDVAERNTLHERGEALLELGRELFRLERVEQVALRDIRARIERREYFESLTVGLFYRVKLRQRLGLLAQPTVMDYEDLAGVSVEQLEFAYREVREAETPETLALSLSQQAFWRSWVEERHPAAFTELEQQVQAPRRALLQAQQGQLEAQAYALQQEALQVDDAAERQALVQQLTRLFLRGRERGQG